MQDRIKKTVLTSGAAVAGLALVLSVDSSAAGAATAAKRVEFVGGAYGSSADVGSLVHSGQTAYVSECTTATGVAHSNKTAAVHLPGVGTVGAVTTRVSSSRKGHTVSSVTTTKTAATSLLGGLVHAKAIATNARVSLSGKTYTSASSSTLVGLSIAGRAVNASAKPNQTIAIAGIGKVILNAQAKSSAGGQHSASTVALQLVIKAGNVQALPAGSVVVGRAVAALHAPTFHNAYGGAYGSTVQIGNTVRSGRTAAVTLPCGGSNGSTLSNKTAAALLPDVLNTGVVTSSAHSSDTGKATTVTTRSRIAAVSLLGGIIKVRAITTEAHAVRTHSHLALSSTGTNLLGLTINGKTQTVPARNTGRTIAGLGTLYFDRTTKTRTGIKVNALELVLSTDHGSAAKGTIIIIGAATAGVRK